MLLVRNKRQFDRKIFFLLLVVGWTLLLDVVVSGPVGLGVSIESTSERASVAIRPEETETDNDSSIMTADQEGLKHNGVSQTLGAGAAGLLGGLLVNAVLGGTGGGEESEEEYGHHEHHHGGHNPYYPPGSPGYVPSYQTGLYSPTFYHPQQRPPNYYPPPGPAYGDEFVASYPGYYAELLHGNTPQEGVTTMRGQQQQQQQQTAQQPPNVQTTDGDLLLHNQRHSASTTAGFIYPILVTAGGVRGDRPFYYPSTIVLNTRPAVKDEQLFNQDESSRLSSSLVKSSTEDDEDYYINYPLMFESDFSLY